MPALLLLLLFALPAAADDAHWPNFRGPRLDGSSEATQLPERWTRSRGVVWSRPLPGPSSATPAVWGDRIFLTAAATADDALLALCVDRASGKILWQHRCGTNRKRGRSDWTSPSPVTDGERVVFMFGNGDLRAFDLAGKPLWRRQLATDYGRLSWIFSYGASPLLHGGTLFVQLMRRPAGDELQPYLLALDPATGKERWKQPRGGKAVDESWESYVTPLPFGEGKDAQIVLIGADAVTGHAAATGRELWRSTYNAQGRRNWRVVPTPVSDGERVFVALPRGESFAALVPGGATDTIAKRALWTATDNIPDVCSPLLYRGRLYLLNGRRGVISCYEPTKGKRLWQATLEGAAIIRASPTAGDGKIYVPDEHGRVYVLRAGDRFEQLAAISMDDARQTRSSIVLAPGRLYIRTTTTLFCVAAAGAKPGD